MKRIYLTSVLAAMMISSFATIHADETKEVQYLILKQGDGTESKLALEDYPEITFVSDTLRVITAKRDIYVALSDVSDYSFVTEKENVETTAITAVEEGVKPQFSKEKAAFTGLKAGAVIRVYNISGQIVSSYKADEEGNATVDISGLPKGVVILRSEGITVKINNK